MSATLDDLNQRRTLLARKLAGAQEAYASWQKTANDGEQEHKEEWSRAYLKARSETHEMTGKQRSETECKALADLATVRELAAWNEARAKRDAALQAMKNWREELRATTALAYALNTEMKGREEA